MAAGVPGVSTAPQDFTHKEDRDDKAIQAHLAKLSMVLGRRMW